MSNRRVPARNAERDQSIYVDWLGRARIGDLALRHGISGSRVQQIIAVQRSKARIARARGEDSYLGHPIPANV